MLEIQRLCPVVPLGVPHGTTKELFINEKWLIPKGLDISEGNCPQFLENGSNKEKKSCYFKHWGYLTVYFNIIIFFLI